MSYEFKSNKVGNGLKNIVPPDKITWASHAAMRAKIKSGRLNQRERSLRAPGNKEENDAELPESRNGTSAIHKT